MGYLLDGEVLATLEHRLGLNDDVHGDPFHRGGACLLADDCREVLGRQAALAGIEGHVAVFAVVLYQIVVEAAEQAFASGSLVGVVVDVVAVEHAEQDVQQLS